MKIVDRGNKRLLPIRIEWNFCKLWKGCYTTLDNDTNCTGFR